MIPHLETMVRNTLPAQDQGASHGFATFKLGDPDQIISISELIKEAQR